MSEWDCDAFGSAYIILIMLLSELRLWTEHLMSIFLSEWVIMCSIAEMSRAAARCIGKATSEETRLNWRSEPTAKESWACLRCSRDPWSMGCPRRRRMTVHDHLMLMRKLHNVEKRDRCHHQATHVSNKVSASETFPFRIEKRDANWSSLARGSRWSIS